VGKHVTPLRHVIMITGKWLIIINHNVWSNNERRRDNPETQATLRTTQKATTHKLKTQNIKLRK